jgi:predicted nuclease with TOPRIM domain
MKPQLMPLKKYYSMWRLNTRLKEEVMRLVSENEHLRRQLEELKSEMVVREQMQK